MSGLWKSAWEKKCITLSFYAPINADNHYYSVIGCIKCRLLFVFLIIKKNETKKGKRWIISKYFAVTSETVIFSIILNQLHICTTACIQGVSQLRKILTFKWEVGIFLNIWLKLWSFFSAKAIRCFIH